MADYEFTVFISYRRKLSPKPDGSLEFGAAGEWVCNLLAPYLERWLPEFVPGAKVAFDGTFPAGVRSQPAIKRAIQHSRCMLAVWSAEYFHSDWCRSEWESMRRREALVEGEVCELVVPLVFADSEHFDDLAKERCQAAAAHAMQKFTVLSNVNEGHALFPDFRTELRNLCGRISDVAKRAPRWKPDFPWCPVNGLASDEPFSNPSLQS